jgi:hypothetical protein
MILSSIKQENGKEQKGKARTIEKTYMESKIIPGTSEKVKKMKNGELRRFAPRCK